MKARIDKNMFIVITPENYEEQYALELWAQKHKAGDGLLIEAYTEKEPPRINIKVEDVQTAEAQDGIK